MPKRGKARKGECWSEQGVTCQIFEKADEPGVAEFVQCGNEGWPNKRRVTVFVRQCETPEQAVRRHPSFAAAVAYAREYATDDGIDAAELIEVAELAERASLFEPVGGAKRGAGSVLGSRGGAGRARFHPRIRKPASYQPYPHPRTHSSTTELDVQSYTSRCRRMFAPAATAGA